MELHNLPDEMLAEIFGNLDSISQLRIQVVCKRWENILTSSPLTRRVVVDIAQLRGVTAPPCFVPDSTFRNTIREQVMVLYDTRQQIYCAMDKLLKPSTKSLAVVNSITNPDRVLIRFSLLPFHCHADGKTLYWNLFNNRSLQNVTSLFIENVHLFTCATVLTLPEQIRRLDLRNVTMRSGFGVNTLIKTPLGLQVGSSAKSNLEVKFEIKISRATCLFPAGCGDNYRELQVRKVMEAAMGPLKAHETDKLVNLLTIVEALKCPGIVKIADFDEMITTTMAVYREAPVSITTHNLVDLPRYVQQFILVGLMWVKNKVAEGNRR